MMVFLVIIHVIVCVALIMIVLLQTGKGADIGAAFGGGGSNTLFGTSGASTFLSKATTVAAIVFMITSLTLAYLSSQRTTTSIVTEVRRYSAKSTLGASHSERGSLFSSLPVLSFTFAILNPLMVTPRLCTQTALRTNVKFRKKRYARL